VIWCSRIAPNDCQTGVIIPTQKKGHSSECITYWEICHVGLITKAYAKCLVEKMLRKQLNQSWMVTCVVFLSAVAPRIMFSNNIGNEPMLKTNITFCRPLVSYNIMSRHRGKTVAKVYLFSLRNNNEAFLKWDFFSMEKLARAKVFLDQKFRLLYLVLTDTLIK